MTYLRPIKVFAKIDVHMEITHFDEKYFYCSHHLYRGDKLMAQGTSKALMISKSGSFTPQYTLDAVARYQADKHPQTISD
ncbi:MAG: acyl-CoA thioesterase FadM [Bermanella sp.]|jgi:acyl-CoA thioesterase FadM